jgi:hypothetical protein
LSGTETASDRHGLGIDSEAVGRLGNPTLHDFRERHVMAHTYERLVGYYSERLSIYEHGVEVGCSLAVAVRGPHAHK